ncbi:TPA: glycosyltransferase [Serratia marcescens]
MILILYVESGTGSITLAKNVQHELNQRGIENRIISLHDLLPAWLNDFLFGHYKDWCVDNKQHFNYIYRSRWFYPALYKVLPLMIRCRGLGFGNSSLFYRVDAVISCSFFCGWFARYWQKRNDKQYQTFGILGDYSVSPGWQLQVDRLFIPFDFQNPVFDFIRRRGGDITVTGIPVTYYQIDSARVKGSVLLCGGGWGLQITEETIIALLARKSLTRLIVLCGQNITLYEKLCLQFQACISRGELEVHGFIDDMCAIYARTDIVVTKAGGLTMTEAAIYGKPLIITGYLPGHEEENMKVFVQRGAALFAGDTDTLGQAIDNVLSSDASAELLRKNAALLVNHQACNLLCNEIMKDIQYVDA